MVYQRDMLTIKGTCYQLHIQVAIVQAECLDTEPPFLVRTLSKASPIGQNPMVAFTERFHCTGVLTSVVFGVISPHTPARIVTRSNYSYTTHISHDGVTTATWLHGFCMPGFPGTPTHKQAIVGNWEPP